MVSPRSGNTRIWEARANIVVVIVLPRQRVNEFVVSFRRYIKELVDTAALEFQFESAVHIRIFMISNLSYTFGRDEGPMHWSRASFQQRDVSSERICMRQSVTATTDTNYEVRSPLPLAVNGWADVTPSLGSIGGMLAQIFVKFAQNESFSDYETGIRTGTGRPYPWPPLSSRTMFPTNPLASPNSIKVLSM